jgi:hypothetical protein
MSTSTQDRISDLEKQLLHLRKRATIQQTLLLGLATLFGLAVCVGATYPKPADGHFKRVYADSLVIRDANGKNAVRIKTTRDGAGSISISDSAGRAAISLISGSERNELLINDRDNGRIAVAVQGMKDRGRLSLLRTFHDVDAAKQTLGDTMQDYLINTEGQVAVPVLRLPE